MRPIISTVDVPTAGTRVQLSNTADSVKKITVISRPTNTGYVYFGTVTVSATVGVLLQPGDAAHMDFGNGSVLFSTFYADTSVNGNDVDYMVIAE